MIASVKRLFKLLVPAQSRQKIRKGLVAINVTHLHGPRKIRLSRNEAAVTCVVKNGEFYIEPFIRHYTEMGFRHIFLLDNGSIDQTVSIAKKYDNVSVCQSTLAIQEHQGLFKQFLAQQAVEGGWCLDADIDEFFDYPFSDAIDIGQFLEYLNRNRYTAVVTQLLDMFSDRTLSHLANKQEEDIKEVYQFYDISQVDKMEYGKADIVKRNGGGNKVSNPDTMLCFGGIRKTLYGNNCLLTKHSLFRPGKGLELFPHVHFVNHANLAAVSCVMLHYKLTSNALETAMQNKEGFLKNSKEYGKFIDQLVNNPKYQIKQGTAVKFRKASELVENGFLFMSEEYYEYVKTAC
jgi:Glycosyl transferase family 2